MTKNRNTISLIIGVFLICWGILKLGIILSAAYKMHLLFSEVYGPDSAGYSIKKIILPFHNGFILSLVSICSGILLILKKNGGWILATSVSIIELLGVVIMAYYFSISAEYESSHIETFDGIIVILISLAFVSISIWLALKKTQLNYQVTRSKWIIAFVIIILFFFDQIFY